jgi:hypothetical protein
MTKTPDTPQVHLEFKTPYGEGTQQVTVQSNRLSPDERFTWSWLNRLYPPDDIQDFFLDAVTYIITAGLLAAIGRYFIALALNPGVVSLLVAIGAGLCVLTWLVCKEIKRGWLLLTYRAVLVAVGVVLGGVL